MTKEMSSREKIFRGFVWTVLYYAVTVIYNLISVPILINYYGKSNFGIIGLAMSINVYLALLDLGLNSTNIRFFSNWLAKGEISYVKKLFQTSMVFYGWVGILNALLLLVISFHPEKIFEIEDSQIAVLRHLLWILAISAFVNWFTSCFDQLIRSNEYVGWTQVVSIIPKVIQLAVLYFAVFLGFTIETYFLLSTFALFSILPLVVNKIKKLCPYITFKPNFHRDVFKIVLPYSLNIFSFSIFQFSMNNLRPVFLGMRDSAAAVADYQVINSLVTLILVLSSAIMGVLLPSSARVVALNDIQAKDKIVYQGTRFVSIFLALCCFGLVTIADDAIEVYVGSDFLHLKNWLVLWSITLMGGHIQAISSLILSENKIRSITIISIFSSCLGLFACWQLIPMYGVGGTVISYTIYILSQLIFYYLYYYPRVLKINPWKIFFKSFLPFLIIGAFISVVIINAFHTPVGLLSLFLKGSTFVVVYLILIIPILSREDKLFIRSLIKR